MTLRDHFGGRLTEERFARLLIERLERAGDVRQARFDAKRFRICFDPSETEGGYVSLGNLYDEYVAYPIHDRERFFRHATRSLLAPHKNLPDEYADARCDIFLAVRNRAYYSLMELNTWMDSDASFSWPYQPLADHLGIGLVYDLPEAMVMLQASHLEQWGVSFYEVYEHALGNLAEVDATFTTIDDHSYVSATNDHYDASRILLTELIRELEVVGDPVVMLPNRDRLLITGSDDRHGLESVALLAQLLMTHPRPMTGLAFRRVNDEWTTWLPNVDHPAYSLLKAVGLQSQQVDYNEQRHLLQQWMRELDPSVEVAEYRMHGANARQPPTSFCVWREGQTLLLPETDRLCLLRHDQPPDHPLVEGTNVSWPRAKDLFDSMIEKESDLYPTRYRVEHFPTDDQLSQL